MRLLRFTLVTAASIALVLLMPLVTSGQDVTAPVLKAAFIFNFVRFTEWPGDSRASGPFVVCVLGDSAVGDALERVVKGRELAGRSLHVSLVATSGPKEACHVLYVSGITTNQAAELVAGLRDTPVLTISDVAGFTNVGGIAQFFFERGRLRFGIELGAAKRARLQMSSRLLALAKRYE